MGSIPKSLVCTPRPRRWSGSLKKGVDGVGQPAVPVGHHVAGIVGVKLNPHVAELVVEDGVVGLLLSEEGHARHEGEGFLEILETEFPDQPVVLFHPHGDTL